jgi:hypothetical protein
MAADDHGLTPKREAFARAHVARMLRRGARARRRGAWALYLFL